MSVLTSIEAFVAVAFPSAQVGYVSDRNGSIYRTDDGGRSWTSVLGGVARLPLRWFLAFPTPAVGFVASQDSLFRTDDGGSTWESLSSKDPDHPNEQRLRVRRSSISATDGPDEAGMLVDLQQVAFRTTDQGYAVVVAGKTTDRGYVSEGLILETINRGYSWEVVENTGDYMHNVCCIGDVLYAVGNNATIVRMDILSRTTRRVSLDSTAPLYSVYFSSRNGGVAVGEGGTIVMTRDAGDTWHRIESGTDGILVCAAFFDQQRGLAGGLWGTLLTTDDGGATWSVAELPRDLNLYDIAITSESTGYIVCSGGIILKTTDAGKTFHFVPFRVT